MSLFKPLEMNIAYAKFGIYGDTGTGKSTSAALIAIGLYHFAKCKKPIAYFDTENSAGWLKPLFDIAKVPVDVVGTRAFSDLALVMSECEKDKREILIVDSITHPWRELVMSWKRKHNRKFIQIQDWGPLKEMWSSQFGEPYINSNLHIIMCGRSGNIFENIEDEDQSKPGKKKFQAVKIGTKMSTENETGYEPNVLMEMNRVYAQHGGQYARQMSIIKDKSRALDGKSVIFGTKDMTEEQMVKVNEPFKFVMAHVERLNVKGQQHGLDVDKSSVPMLEDPASRLRWQERERRELILEDITELMNKYFTGSTALVKKNARDFLEATAGTSNKVYIKTKMSLGKLEMVLDKMQYLVDPERKELTKLALRQGISTDEKTIEDEEAAVKALRDMLKMRAEEAGQQDFFDKHGESQAAPANK